MSFLAAPIQKWKSWMGSGDKARKKVFSLTEGSQSDELLLSAKFASLCELWKLGLGTPPGFILSTVSAKDYLENKAVVSEELSKEVWSHVAELEQFTGKQFGSQLGPPPLLLAVRVGIPAVQQQVTPGCDLDFPFSLSSLRSFFIIICLTLSSLPTLPDLEPSSIACYRDGERLGDDTSGDLNVLSLLGAPESW